MFYLIGVNHDAQRRAKGAVPTPSQQELECVLCDCIRRYRPEVIAVEESNESLEGRESIPVMVATRAGVWPVLCDPEQEERTALGYRNVDSIQQGLAFCRVPGGTCRVAAEAIETQWLFPIREDCWIKKLENFLQKDVVFVCGENHIDSLTKELIRKGIRAEVVKRRIGLTADNVNTMAAVAKFRAENKPWLHAQIAECEKQRQDDAKGQFKCATVSGFCPVND